MKSTNLQILDQDVDQPRGTIGNAAGRSLRRSSQPRFVLQPVVFDDRAALDTSDRYIEPAASDDAIGREAMVAAGCPCSPIFAPNELPVAHDVRSWRGSCTGDDQTHAPLIDRRVLLRGRSAIIGALFVCSVIAIALFVTLLLAGRAPVA